VGEIHCVMVGLGGPTFITDWAKAVSRFARVTGVTMVGRLPAGALPVGQRLAVTEIDGIETVFVRRTRLRPVRVFWRLNARLEARAMVAAIRRMDGWTPDILHSHFFAGAAAIPRAADQLGIPFVHTEHTSHLAGTQPREHLSAQGIRIMQLVFARAATVMLVGQEQLDSARALGATGNMVVVPNPVDASIFSAHDNDRFGSTIVTIGHLVARKRHELLLRAASLVWPSVPELRVDLIGDGPERDRLETLARTLGISDIVRFRGSCDRQTVSDLLTQSTIYVHSSERESFGVSIVEALLTGLPVVTLACGGVSSELVDEVGLVVTVATPEALAAAIGEAVTNRSRFASPSEIAEWARVRYGFDQVAAVVAERYRSALGR
jgi:glycosyltransferase involved in cell wall biosynthesis